MKNKKTINLDAHLFIEILDTAQVAYSLSHILTGAQRWSETFYRILGLSPEKTLPSTDLLLSTVHPEDRAHLLSARQEAIADQNHYEIEFRMIQKNGQECLLKAQGTVCSDQTGQKACLIEILQAHTENPLDKKNNDTLKEEVENSAYKDPLTGLPNRQLFYDRLEQTIQHVKRNHTICALLYIDLDNFKTINDTRGHWVGDLYLQEIARRLKECARAGDTVSRLGGDEFALILETLTEEKEAAIVAERIVKLISIPFYHLDESIYASVSIGISVCPRNGTSSESLLKNADVAMYHAKKTGKNRFHFFTKTLNEKIIKQAAIETALRKSMKRKELETYFQPIISLKDHQIISMEALIRWPQADGTFIPPDEFIPLAEKRGLISDIDKFMIHKACGFVQEIISNTSNTLAQKTHVSVNLSSVDFERIDLCKHLLDVVQWFGLEPHHIGIEITETMLIKNMKLAIEHLSVLREQGFSVSIDDFGTGYSSLNYLAQLPIDILKMDGSFVLDLPDNRRNSAIAKAIVLMAHEMGIQVIAEGVETEAQLDFLRDIDCDQIQGHIFSPALPRNKMENLLTQAAPFIETGVAVLTSSDTSYKSSNQLK